MKLVAKCGGGVNSWAMFVLLKRLGIRPDAIVMADPGDEWDETERYRDTIGADWLARWGFPPVTVVSRGSEALYRPRASKTETLFEECARLASPPSAAYGRTRCSMQYKATPSFWWLQRQGWAQAERQCGRRIAIAIGYDFDEGHRAEGRADFKDPLEAAWCYPIYPLYEVKADRDDCESLILQDIGVLPPKSACRRCPNNTLEDWYRLYDTRPDIYQEALDLSRRSVDTIESPSVGFLRGFAKQGRRQLHAWHDGEYPDMPLPPHRRAKFLPVISDMDRDEIHCECAL